MKNQTILRIGSLILFCFGTWLCACPLQPPTGDIEIRVNDIIVTDMTVNVGETVTFIATDCFCPDYPFTIAQYQWIFPSQAYCISGDRTSTARCKFYPATQSGVTYRVELRIKCQHGLWNAYIGSPIDVFMTVDDVTGPWHVSPAGNDDNNGQTWDNAFRNIQTAIDFASDGDTIFVREGTYYEQLDMKGKNLDIRSSNNDYEDELAPDTTIIDANELGTAILFRGNEKNGPGTNEVAALKGFTIRNGHPADDGMALHLKLNETGTTTDAMDDSGKVRNGTLNYFDFNGDSGWTTDSGRNVLKFDGSNDHININNYKGIVGKGSRTCSAWIKTNGTQQGIIVSWGSDQNGQKWTFRVEANGTLAVGVWGGYVYTSATVNNNQWHHVAAVLNDDGSPNVSEILLYIDGVLRSTGANSTQFIETVASQDVLIGACKSGSSLYSYFNGLMDDVRIFSRALSEGEIQQQAISGPVAYWKLDGNTDDSSGNQLNGIPQGTPGYSDGILNQAMVFDGTNDFVELPSGIINPAQDSFSAFAWVYLDSKLGTSSQVILQQKDNGTLTGRGWLARSADDKLFSYIGGGSTISTTAVFSKTNQWRYVGVTYDGRTVRLYCDGRECGSSNKTAENCDGGLFIGRHKGNDPATQAYWDGMIDDVRIYDRAITSSKIQALYQQRFAAGGGIRGNGAQAAISHCIIKQNQSDVDGGGLADCNGLIGNCIIAENNAPNGGAMANCDGPIENCTIAANIATESGAAGGLWNCNSATIRNNIIWQNSIYQLLECSNPNYSCIQGWTGTGGSNINRDPGFVDADQSDYHLSTVSYCIDKGDPSIQGGEVDIDGQSRVQGLTIDIGADEWDGTIWYVDDDNPNDILPHDPNVSDPDEDGTLQHPFDSIQEAISVIQSPYTNKMVVVLDGTYTGTGNRDIDFAKTLNPGVFVTRAITVRSQNGPETCIIDCNGLSADPHRGFYFHNDETSGSVIDGFTITNGYATNANGFEFIYSNGCGGGIACNNSSPTIQNCIIKDNKASEYGGGIFACYGSNPSIVNCLILANTAQRGAAIYSKFNSSHSTLTNCTIVNNISSVSGTGAVYHYDASSTLINCILSGNSSPVIGIQSDATCSISYSCISETLPNITWLTKGNGLLENTNPSFISTTDFHLQGTSYCIDAGNNDPIQSYNILSDIDGNPRRIDSPDANDIGNGMPPIVDIGAYEKVYWPPVAMHDTASTLSGQPVVISVLANDTTYPEHNPLTISCVAGSGPLYGSVDIVGTTVTYTPESGFVGSDHFQYTISDHHGASNKATVTVNVSSNNHAPVANDDEKTIIKGTPQVIINILNNDTDIDTGDKETLVVYSCTQPSNGQITHTTANVTYTPAIGFSGIDTFTYIARDSHGLPSNEATVTVHVIEVDAGPNQSIRLPINRVYLDAAVMGASDGATIAWSVFNGPVGSQVTFDDSYTLLSPDTKTMFSQPGVYILQLEVISQGLPVKDQVIVTVEAGTTAGNQPPQVWAKAEPNEIILPVNTTTLEWIISDDGVSRGGLSQYWEVVDGPISGEVSFGIYSPQSRQTQVTFSTDGVYILRLTASDGIDQTTANVKVLVNQNPASNLPPVVEAGPNRQVSLLSGQCSITLDDPAVMANDPDNKPNPLTIGWSVLNSTSGITITAGQNPLYPTLTVTKAGQYVVQLEASDGLTTVTDTMLISTSSVMVNAGPDQVVVLPDNGQVTYPLSGTCTSEPAGLFSSTEWEIEIQPDPNNPPVFSSISELDPNVIFTESGDYVFKLIAKDAIGEEIASDEVYIKVKPASQVFTTYLYLYAPPTGSNLVFSSYEDGTKLAWQKVDPNGILSQIKDVNPTTPNDPNLDDISDACPMVKGQYAYIEGQDSVYKVTSGNNKFSVLAGDVYGEDADVDYDNVSGYFVMSKNGLGADTEFYSHVHGRNERGRLAIFAYQDNTHVTVHYEELGGGNGIVEQTDPNMIMEKYDPQKCIYEDAEMDNYELSANQHVSMIPHGTIDVPRPIYIHLIADKPVSVEMCNDSGFFVPSSDGSWAGKEFLTFIDFGFGYNTLWTTDFEVYSYENNTDVSIVNNEKKIWSGIIHEGEKFSFPTREMTIFDEYDAEQKAYFHISSNKRISVNVRRSPDWYLEYAHGDFVPDKKGTGAGIDLIGYCVKECTVPEYNPNYYTRYFTVLAHNDDTQFRIYDPETWEPRNLISGTDNPNDTNDRTVFTLNEGQCFKAENYLSEVDHSWRVVSTKPVTISTGANKAFAEYAPLAGIQSTTPKVEMTAGTGKGYPGSTNDPTVHIGIAGWDEVAYTISYWNPSTNPPVYGQKIVDELPDLIDRDSVQFTGSNGSYDKETNTITWDIGMLETGQGEGDPCQVTVTVRVNQHPKNCNKIVNRALIKNVDSYVATLPVILPVDMTWPAIDDIIYVDSYATGLNNGSSWQDAFNDLQKALQIAPSSGASQIWVAAGIYSPGPLFGSTFHMQDGVNLYGSFAGAETSILERDLTDPNNCTILTGLSGNEYVVTAANSILDGFTVREGEKAGISCDNKYVTVNNCIIENNNYYDNDESIRESYGIYCSNGASPKITNNIIRGNLKGIYLCHSNNAEIFNNLILNNSTGIGLDYLGGQTLIRNNTIVNNDYNIQHYNSRYGGNQADLSNCIIWGDGDFDFNVLTDIGYYDTCLFCCRPDPNLVDWTIIDPNTDVQSTSHSIFENYYLYGDRTVSVSDANYICVGRPTRYRGGEKIEINNDDVLRTITRINDKDGYDVMDFIPVYPRPIPAGVSVYKWGADATSAIEDYHIKGNARCVNAGLYSQEMDDEVDIDGQPRVIGAGPNGTPSVDIGADEYSGIFAGQYPVQILQSTNTVDLSFDQAWDYMGYGDYEWSYEGVPGSVSYVNSTSSDDLRPTVRFSMPGVYVFKIEAFDANNHSAGYNTTSIKVYLDVNAGLDRDVFLNNGYWDETLTGIIVGGTADHVLWTKVSGPDGITILSPASIQATAAFTKPGYYQLRLSTYDANNKLIGFDDVVITAHCSNLFVEAGSDQNIQLTEAGSIQVVLDEAWYIASDSATSVTERWEIETSKPVQFGHNGQGFVTVTFHEKGAYVLTYIVTEGGGQSRTDTLTVRVYPKDAVFSVYAGTDLYGIIGQGGTASVQAKQAFVYPTAGTVIQWYDQDETSIPGATTENPVFTFNLPGVYTYKLKALRAADTVEDTVKITIYPQSTGQFIIQTGQYEPVLAGQAFSLSDAFVWYDGAAALTYEWSSDDPANVLFSDSNDDGLTSHVLWPDVEFTEGLEKVYTLTLTVRNNGTQIGSASVSIQAVTEMPPLTDTEPPQLILTSNLLHDDGTASALPQLPSTIDGETVSIEIYALDTSSGLSAITVERSIDGGPSTQVQSWDFSQPALYPTQVQVPCYLDVLSLAAGVYTITVTVTDRIGNDASQTVTFEVTRPAANTTSNPYAVISNLKSKRRTYGKLGFHEEPNEITVGLYPIQGVASHPAGGQEVQFKFELFDPAATGYDPNDWNILDGNNPPYPDYLVQRLKVYGATEVQGAADYYQGPVGSINNDGTSPAGFGNLDLTGVSNGTYYLLLTVRSQPDAQTAHKYSYAVKQFVLNCPLKIGNVKFSQEDTIITVGGIPLSVVRTYDSFQKDKSGDFGFGWSYSIANMDIQLEEDREDMAVWEEDWGPTPDTESIRISSNYDRNVTLTLPDGNRATFMFYLEYNDGNLYNAQTPFYIARYQSPEGVTATLETLVEERLNTMNVWEGQDTASHFSGSSEGGYSDPAYYEFSGYRLITDDGTQYIFQRKPKGGDLYGDNADYIEPLGEPYLAYIVTPTGEMIHMNVDENTLRIGQDGGKGVECYMAGATDPNKAITIEYGTGADAQRIAAIYAPAEQGGSVPTVRYDYDAAGNLWKVRKLVDKTLAAADPNTGYEVLTYEYDNTQFDPADHYITAIKDPRGLQPIQYLYDDAGRLTGTKDAKGNTIAIEHDITGRQEIVTDRAGNPTFYEYDDKGNVKSVTDCQGNWTRYTYDSNNPLKISNVKTTTSQVPNYEYPDQPLDAITTYDYVYYTIPNEAGYGKLASQTVTDPVKNQTVTNFDTNGNVTSTTQNKWNGSSYVEVLTTQTKYTTNNLPYLTGTTTGPDTALEWHSISLTYYDDKNRVTHSVQVNMDDVTYADLFDTWGNLKAYEAIDDTLLATSSVTSYHYFTSSTQDGYSPDQPSYIIGPDGQMQVFGYDENNTQVASWNFYEDPFSDDYCQYQSASDFDDAGRVIQSRQVVTNVAGTIAASNRLLSQTFYTGLGKVDYTLDENGNKTVFDYDETGNAVQTSVFQSVEKPDPQNPQQTILVYEPLTVTRTLYDKNDRVLVSVTAWDAANPDAEPTGTETVYDALGRAFMTRQWKNVHLDLQWFKVNVQGQKVFESQAGYASIPGDPVGMSVPSTITAANAWDGTGTQPTSIGWTAEDVLPAAGSEASRSETEYDSAGRVWKTWAMKSDRAMVCTNEYTYDLAGRQVDVITLPGTDDETVTTTEYDGSRRWKVTDGRDKTTEFIYDALGRVITTKYNESTSVTTLNQDRSANTQTGVTYVHVGYDGLGRKVWESQRTALSRTSVDQLTDPDHAKLCKDFAYNTSGQLVGVVLPSDTANRPQYDYFYDTYGNQIGILDAEGQLTITIYNYRRQPVYRYMPFVPRDGGGNPIPIVSSASIYALNLSGKLYTEFHYDAFDRLSYEIDSKGQKTVYDYYDSTTCMDTKGTPEQTDDELLGMVGALRCKDYYPVSSATPTGRVKFYYDALGRKTEETKVDVAANGTESNPRQWTYEYDTDGSLKRILSPDGTAINYDYYAVTGQKEFTWTDKTTNKYEYDSLGRLQNVRAMIRGGQTLSPTEVTSYQYDENGNRKSITLQNGIFTEYSYNELNGLTNLTHWRNTGKVEAQKVGSYTYQQYANGMRARVVESVNENHVITYQYDARNQLLEEQNYDTNGYGYTASYAYDLNGNRESRAVEVTNADYTCTLTTAYDYYPDSNRLHTETVSAGGLCAMLPWGGDGRVLAYRAGTSYSFQMPGQIQRLGEVGAMFVGLPSWWNTVLFYAVIVLIPVSLFWPVFVQQWRRLKGSVDPQGPPNLKLWHRCMCVLLAYVFFVTPDGFIHLSQAAIQYGDLSTASWGQGDTTIVYEYDDNGSTTKKTTKTTSTQIIREVVDYGYNLQGKLKEVRTNKQAGTVDVAQYYYTPSGDRYKTTTWTETGGTPGSYQTKLFVVDTSNPTGYSQVLEEWTYDVQNPVYGTTVPASVKYYTIGDDVISQAIGSDTSAGTSQYLLYDGHGSTRQLLNYAYNVDGNGKPIVSDSYSYDGYGVMLGSAANAENNAQTSLLYCGEQYDKALNQYYLRARYYNPRNGLFNQMDPYAGNMQDPQSLHKYTYCHNNPINAVDPSGLMIGGGYTLSEVLMISAIMGLLCGIVTYNVTGSVTAAIVVGVGIFLLSFYALGGIGLMQAAFAGGTTAAGGIITSSQLLPANSWQQAERLLGQALQLPKNTLTYFYNGMTRGGRPDFIKPGEYIADSKWVMHLQITDQLRNYVILAQQWGVRFDIYVRQSTVVDPSVQQLVQNTGGNIFKVFK